MLGYQLPLGPGTPPRDQAPLRTMHPVQGPCTPHPWDHAPRCDHAHPQDHATPPDHAPPTRDHAPPRGQTDTCKNITFATSLQTVNITRIHSSRMCTVHSSSCLLGRCLPQCMLGYTSLNPRPGPGHPRGLGLDTPGSGPGHPQAWTWTPPGLGLDTPRPGPGHPQADTSP